LVVFLQTSTVDGKLKQTTIGSLFAKHSSTKGPATTQQQMNTDFMIWLALDLEPFGMVNNRGLRYFFHKNFPSVTVPDESTLRKSYVKDVYDLVFDQVKSEMAEVKTITLMFDGWTDKYHAVHYLGLRAQYITDDWTGKVVTLSVKPCGGDSDSIADHVQKEVGQFIPDYKQKQLFSTHDGASAMKKVSRLLKVTDFMHCVAHALHLLLTTDGMTRVPAIVTLLRKCKDIVNKLHFKAEILEREVAASNDAVACADFLDKITDIKALLDADDQFDVEIDDDGEQLENEDSIDNDGASEVTGVKGPEGCETSKPTTKLKKVHRLQNDIPTRWNSSLDMISSLIHLRDEVSNALKQTGNYDMCLRAHEWAVLEELRVFLQAFATMTDLVSSRITTLSLIPLIRAEIADACSLDDRDCDEVKSLKKLVARNMDKRLPLTKDVILSTLFDPSTKSIVQLSDDEKEEMVYKAVTDQRKPPGGTGAQIQSCSTSNDPTSQSQMTTIPMSAPIPVSKKMKLILKHTPQLDQPDSQTREEIKNYLRYIWSSTEDEDPLVFWKRGLFPALQEPAKKYLTRSASSVPVENLFSTMGLILNGKRSTLAPHRANWLSFIHDNYELYFDVDF